MEFPPLVPVLGSRSPRRCFSRSEHRSQRAPPAVAQYFNGGTNCIFAEWAMPGKRARRGRPLQRGAGRSPPRARASVPRKEAKPQNRTRGRLRPCRRPNRGVTHRRRQIVGTAPDPEPAGPSQQQAVKAFAAARALILSEKIRVALRALGYDDHPECAASIGYASSKLGASTMPGSGTRKRWRPIPHARVGPGVLWDMARSAGRYDPGARRPGNRALCGGTTCTAYKELTERDRVPVRGSAIDWRSMASPPGWQRGEDRTMADSNTITAMRHERGEFFSRASRWAQRPDTAGPSRRWTTCCSPT